MPEAETMHVVPKQGLSVPYPAPSRELLPVKGAAVPRDSYWLRRLREGDVTEIDPPAKPFSKKD